MKLQFLLILLSFTFLTNAQSQEGKLSIYSDEHKGRMLASGEEFSKTENWAAHEQIPINSIVKIKNLKNGQSVEVKIKDRGPFKIGYITQVPAEVARELGVKNGDLIKLKLIQSSEENQKIDYKKMVSSFDKKYEPKNKVIEKKSSSSKGKITWQLASFSNPNNAKKFITRHQENFDLELFVLNPSRSLFKVCVGKFKNREKANQAKTNFNKEYQSAFIYNLP